MSLSLFRHFSSKSFFRKSLVFSTILAGMLMPNVHANTKNYSTGVWTIDTDDQYMDENWWGEVIITASDVTFYMNGYHINGMGSRNAITVYGSGVDVVGDLDHDIVYCNNGVVVYGDNVEVNALQITDYVNSFAIYAEGAHYLTSRGCWVSSMNGGGIGVIYSDHVGFRDTRAYSCFYNGIYIGSGVNPGVQNSYCFQNGHSGLCLNSLTSVNYPIVIGGSTFNDNSGWAGVAVENCYGNQISFAYNYMQDNHNYGIYRSNSTNVVLDFDGDGTIDNYFANNTLGNKNW